MKKETTKQENGKYTLTLKPENKEEQELLSRIAKLYNQETMDDPPENKEEK